MNGTVTVPPVVVVNARGLGAAGDERARPGGVEVDERSEEAVAGADQRNRQLRPRAACRLPGLQRLAGIGPGEDLRPVELLERGDVARGAASVPQLADVSSNCNPSPLWVLPVMEVRSRSRASKAAFSRSRGRVKSSAAARDGWLPEAFTSARFREML